MNMNDRALRHINVGLGGHTNGFPREDGFDIVVASEVMAIFCLATSLADLRERLGNIVIGYTRARVPVRARDLGVHGAMAVLLKDAVHPNLVQTLEHTPAFVHGGPFANIAHGCNSVIATRAALKLADYVVTEAGFGADLGAEKFIDIKCRKAGLQPAVAVLVATVRALKYHGGAALAELQQENLVALEKGFVNLERHVRNLREQFGLRVVVALNHFFHDTDAEVELLRARLADFGTPLVVARHWAEGGRGAEPLAQAVLDAIEQQPDPGFRFLYDESLSLWDKVRAIAGRLYGAADVTADSDVLSQVKRLEEQGYGRYPVCVAKTQYSFSTDAKLRGAPAGHLVKVREVRLNAGAEFVVMVCGEIMTMPGLPKAPAAEKIDVDAQGRVVGLF
jgi:formate--tetrahydrofolate ligase